MNIDYTFVQKDLDDYLSILLGLKRIKIKDNKYTNTNYVVSFDRAMELSQGLENILKQIGNNPYMAGSYICPWSRFGQRVNKKKKVAIRPYLRMYDYKYSKSGIWHIVYVVDEAHDLVRFIKLYGNGYNTGKRLLYPNSEPILECLRWMVKLGCFNQYQVESLKERGIL